MIYNKNSIFYTVPSLAEFDQYGIWHYKEASFSKWGNLFETIVQLTDHSDMGYTNHKLREILKIKVYDPYSYDCLVEAGTLRYLEKRR